jgi:uncharacterized membrane-anchored protein
LPEPALDRAPTARLYSAAKVPEITVLFWVIKILTTGMGEAASDYLGNTNLALAGVVGVGGLVLTMRWQLRTAGYHAAAYWSAVAMVAVFGTMAADLLHVVLGLSYLVTTPFYALALTVVLTWWYRSEGTLSIHSITTRRRELFYWATVLTSFALGTAAGDLTAATFGLGFLDSGYLFGAMILVPLVAWRLGLNAVGAFWAAYILTRPLGASFADWFGKPPSLTGLDLGDGTVTWTTLAAIVVLVVWVGVRKHGVQQPGGEPERELQRA